MVPGQSFLTLVRSGQPSLVYLDLENLTLKITHFSTLKKITSDRVIKYPGQRRVSLLFTADQKYAQVGSGPISTFMNADPQGVL